MENGTSGLLHSTLQINKKKFAGGFQILIASDKQKWPLCHGKNEDHSAHPRILIKVFTIRLLFRDVLQNVSTNNEDTIASSRKTIFRCRLSHNNGINPLKTE